MIRHIPTIEEISPGTILLNQYNGTDYINGQSQNLSGTYVLQFHNVTVKISDKSYNFWSNDYSTLTSDIAAKAQYRGNIVSLNN